MAGYNRKVAAGGPDHLSGKRGAPRRPRSLFVTCIGSGGELNCRTVDLSKGGMLLEIRDRASGAPGTPTGLIPFAARVADLYPEGMSAVFGDGAVKVHATVVRVATHPTDEKAMRLGCRFDTPLSEAQCHLLGLDGSETADPALTIPEESAPEAAPARDAKAAPAAPVPAAATRKPAAAPAPVAPPAAPVRASAKPVAPAPPAPPASPALDADDEPWGDELARIGRANASTPRARPIRVARGTVLVHLFSRTGPLMGPRFVGTLSEVKGRTLVVALPTPRNEPDPVAYAATLGASARAVCLRDGRVLWDVPTRVEFVAVADENDAVVRITLLAQRPPPATIRRFETARSVTPAA
jgi:hypothetical protein